MDKDSFFKALMAGLIAFLLWVLIFGKKPPQQVQQTDRHESKTATSFDADMPLPEGVHFRGASEEEFVELGNIEGTPDSPYRLHLRLSTRGASVVYAQLSDYAKTVNGEERYEIAKPLETTQGKPIYSFITDKLNLNQDKDYRIGSTDWAVKKTVADEYERAVFTLELVHNDTAFAKLYKTYTLIPQTVDGGHHDLHITLRLENLADKPVAAILTQLGPVGLTKEDQRQDIRSVSAGVQEGLELVSLIQQQYSDLKEIRQLEVYDTTDSQAELTWIAVANKFFAAIMAPVPESEGARVDWIETASALRLGDSDEHDGLSFELVTRSVSVDPGQSIERHFDCYLGPKDKTIFKSDPVYVRRNYVQLINADYYWCAFTAIVNLMLWLLNTSYALIPNYGVAIIILVLVVRTLLHPLTKKGQVNMTKMAQQMSELQPKMEAIRKKYANDKQKQNQEIMKLYQEQGVNPAGQFLTCMPMMLQMPIWGALWAALNFTVEMRHEPFIWWIQDLTAPDALFTLQQAYPLIGHNINLLPPLLGIGMWLQQRFMPKPATATKREGKSADQMTQQRVMMAFMSVFMVFIFYNAPSGLTLYIMASNFFGLVEQYFIRKHLKEQEGRSGAATHKDGTSPNKPTNRVIKKPKFLEKLEKMADDAKNK